jgi:glutamate-ammonia-ligase adenylyltransferase
VASPSIETDKKPGDFAEELAELLRKPSALSPADFDQKIRRYKYREYLRLTVKDFSQAAGLASVMHELSDLAVVLLKANLEYLLSHLTKEWGRPFTFGDDQKKKSCGFSVIAMGKLGGRELNYSSDVDLQFVYESDEGGGGKSKFVEVRSGEQSRILR